VADWPSENVLQTLCGIDPHLSHQDFMFLQICTLHQTNVPQVLPYQGIYFAITIVNKLQLITLNTLNLEILGI
jgi:hypothetical protein